MTEGTPDSTLVVGLDARPHTEGTKQVVKNMDAIKSAAQRDSEAFKKSWTAAVADASFNATAAMKKMLPADRAYTIGMDAARSMSQAIDAQFKRDEAMLHADVKRGLVSTEDAKVAAKMNAEAYNNELRLLLESAQGLKAGSVASGTISQLTSQFKEFDQVAVAKAGGSSVQGLGRLRYSLGALAAGAVGLPGIFGRMAAIFGSFAMGGGIMMGVLAGIFALGMAWKLLSADTKEVTKHFDEAKQSLEKLQETILKGDAKTMEPRAATSLVNYTKQQYEDATESKWYTQTTIGKVLLARKKKAMEDAEKLQRELAPANARTAANVAVGESDTQTEQLAKKFSYHIASKADMAAAKALIAEQNTELKEYKDKNGKEAYSYRGKRIGEDEYLKAVGSRRSLQDAIAGTHDSKLDSMESQFKKLVDGANDLLLSLAHGDTKIESFDKHIRSMTDELLHMDQAYEKMPRHTAAQTAAFARQHEVMIGLRQELQAGRDQLVQDERDDIMLKVNALAANKPESIEAKYNRQMDELNKSRDKMSGTGSNPSYDPAFIAAEENIKWERDFALIEFQNKQKLDQVKGLGIGVGTTNTTGQVLGIDSQLAQLTTLRAQTTDIQKREDLDRLINEDLILRNSILDKEQAQLEKMNAEYQKMEKEISGPLKNAFLSMIEGNQKAFTNFIQSMKKDIESMIASIAATKIAGAVMGVIGKIMLEQATPGGAGAGHFLNTILAKGVPVAGTALAAGMVGYGLGHMTTNKAAGGAMGAAGGAAAGAVIGSIVPVVGTALGAIVGGIAGFVGGLMGSAAMAWEAEINNDDALAAFNASLDKYVATSKRANSTVMDQLTANDQQYRQLVAQTQTTLSGTKHETQRNADLQALQQAKVANDAVIKENFFRSITQQLNAVEGNNYANEIEKINLAYLDNMNSAKAAGASIQQLTQVENLRTEALKKAQAAQALDVKTSGEDLRVRTLMAQGRTYEADRLKQQIAQEKELAAAQEKWGATNPELIAQLKQVQALEKLHGATELANAVRGGPTGFRALGYSYEFANIAMPSAPTYSSPSTSQTTTTTNVNMTPGSVVIDGTLPPMEMAQKLVDGLHMIAQATGGINAKPSVTMDRM